MSKFTTPLDLRAHGVKKWEVLTEFEYWRENDANEVIKVPKGFITDLATIPRVLWSILPPHDTYAKAAVLHDYLYNNAINSKEYADDVFDEALKVLGIPPWKRKIMVTMVKIFGRGNYHKTKDPHLKSKKPEKLGFLSGLRLVRRYINDKIFKKPKQ